MLFSGNDTNYLLPGVYIDRNMNNFYVVLSKFPSFFNKIYKVSKTQDYGKKS